MNPYILIILNFVTSINFIVISQFDINNRLRRCILFLHAITLSSIVTLRDFDYGDTLNYKNFYISDYTYLNMEPLFEFLAYFFRFFSPESPIYFFFFISFLTIFILNIAINKIFSFPRALYIIWAIGSFYTFYYFTFETIRDGLAYSILFYSFTFILLNKQNWKFYLGVIVASLFHYSYMVFLFLPIFMKFNRKKELLIILISLILLTLSMEYINILNTDLNIIIKKIIIYKDMTSNSKTILIRNLLFFALTPFVIKYSISNNYSKIYLFFILILVVSMPFEEANRRFLFKGTLLILIPFVIFSFKNKVVWLLTIFILAYYYLFLINYEAMYGLLNYKPLLELKL